MRRRQRDVERVDVSDMSPEERREAFMRWWRAKLAAQDRAHRTGDRGMLLRWLRDNPKPTPNIYDHLRDPRGRG